MRLRIGNRKIAHAPFIMCTFDNVIIVNVTKKDHHLILDNQNFLEKLTRNKEKDQNWSQAKVFEI